MKYTKLLLMAFIVFSCSKEKPPVTEPDPPKVPDPPRVSYVTWKGTCSTGDKEGPVRTIITFETRGISNGAKVEVRYVDKGELLGWVNLVRNNDDVTWNAGQDCSTTAKLYLAINNVVQDSTGVTCQACN